MTTFGSFQIVQNAFIAFCFFRILTFPPSLDHASNDVEIS